MSNRSFFEHNGFDNYLRSTWFLFAILVIPITLFAQADSTKSKLSFNADFRFRVEQDWDSRKADGTFRDDRTRFRYRVRAGANYEDKWYSAGIRIRTGRRDKQQDPQLTLGAGAEEFGTLPIGLEKAFFQGKWENFRFWVGKNTFPYEKSNELFWSDNVFPEGIYVGKRFKINSGVIDYLDINGGHFIMSSSGKSLNQDTYFQGLQAHLSFGAKRFELFPSLYLFKNVPNIPDGNETFRIDYTILHVGGRLRVLKRSPLIFELDYYQNLQDYTRVDSIPSNLRDQKSSVVVALKYGDPKQKGDWEFAATYAYLQQYSAVDFMAQNDWARWDYSAFGSPDGRLTNFNGIELVAGFMINKMAALKMKYYLVEQLVPYGITNETGSRIRLDLDVNF